MKKMMYDQCFISYHGEQKFPLGHILAKFDDTFIKGSHAYFLHWVMPDVDITAEAFQIGHPPHMHKSAELLFHIGTNPRNPSDLGAEIEFSIGEEMEKHIITKTTVVYIPPNVVHAPWRPLRIDRPFIFLEVNQELKHTEKFLPHLMPEDKRARVDWSIWQDVGY
jgi:hypothetical protein